MPIPIVKGAMLVRVNSLSRGHSGVRWKVLQAILAFLNHGLVPCVPLRGSISASGDLSPVSVEASWSISEGTTIATQQTMLNICCHLLPFLPALVHRRFHLRSPRRSSLRHHHLATFRRLRRRDHREVRSREDQPRSKGRPRYPQRNRIQLLRRSSSTPRGRVPGHPHPGRHRPHH